MFLFFKWLGVNQIKTAQICRKTFVIICRSKMILFPLRSKGTVRRLIPTSNGSSWTCLYLASTRASASSGGGLQNFNHKLQFSSPPPTAATTRTTDTGHLVTWNCGFCLHIRTHLSMSLQASIVSGHALGIILSFPTKHINTFRVAP